MHMVMTSDETRIQMFADWPVLHVFVNKTIAQAQELERNVFRPKRSGVVATPEQGRKQGYCRKEMTSDIE